MQLLSGYFLGIFIPDKLGHTKVYEPRSGTTIHNQTDALTQVEALNELKLQGFWLKIRKYTSR